MIKSAELHRIALSAKETQNERLLGELAHHSQIRVFNYMRRCIGNTEEARDLTQEVMKKFAGGWLLQRWRIDRSGNFNAFLMRTAENQLNTFFKQQKRTRAQHFTDTDQEKLMQVPSQNHEEDPAKAAEKAEERERIRKALESINGDFAHALVLKEVDQLSEKEIADMLGVPQGTVKSRIARAKQQLRANLSEEDFR